MPFSNLLTQVVEKKFFMSFEDKTSGRESYWDFYQCYNMCLAILLVEKKFSVDLDRVLYLNKLFKKHNWDSYEEILPLLSRSLDGNTDKLKKLVYLKKVKTRELFVLAMQQDINILNDFLRVDDLVEAEQGKVEVANKFIFGVFDDYYGR